MTVRLDDEQRAAFHRHGVLVIQKGVDLAAVLDPRRQYTRWRHKVITQGADPRTRQDIARARQAMEVTEGLEIVPLREAAHSLGRALLGDDNVVEIDAQFIGWPPSDETWKPTWHIDWVNKHLKLETEDQFPGFQLLVGFPLTTALNEDQGNLFVCPGQHWTIANMFQRSETLSEPMKIISAGIAKRQPIGTPWQLLMEPGDIVIAHSLIPHGVARNTGVDFADKLYFRLAYKTESRRGGRAAVNHPWSYWEGLNNLLD